MKYSLWLLFLLPLLAVECEENNPIAPIDQLPPETRTGEYTFGCLVNGEAFVPESTNQITAIYLDKILQIGGGAFINPGEQDIQLFIYSSIQEGVEYSLTDSLVSGSRLVVRGTDISTCRYEPENTLSGTLTITHFDSINYIVSGTFEFTTATKDCDTIRVTDGRFDIPYIP